MVKYLNELQLHPVPWNDPSNDQCDKLMKIVQADLIIEPRLREQFEIAHPTEPYKRLLEYLPGEFVGTGARLRTIVEAVSTAMAEAFRAQDMSLPPWRRASAALSKWNLVLLSSLNFQPRSCTFR